MSGILQSSLVRLALAAGALGTAACTGNRVGDPGALNIPLLDSVDVEGEFRLLGGKGEWRRCVDGKAFRMAPDGQAPLADRYKATSGHTGAAVKVWMKVAWLPDSSMRFLALTHMDPAGRCAALPNVALAGSYSFSLAAMAADERAVQLELFPAGLAVQYSTFRHGPDREEFGTWGLDSDGLLQLTWPQRPLVLTFHVRGDSLVQHNARNVDAIATFVRTGAPELGHGTLGVVLALLSEMTSKPPSAFDAITLGTPLSALGVNEAAMDRLADLLAERHGMAPELRERRWSSITTVQDLLELVRTL